MVRKLVVLCAAQVAVGCISISSMQTARAVPEGQLRTGVGMEVGILSPPDANNTLVVVPVPEVGLRYGLGSGLDVGAKAGPLGASFDLKAELVGSSSVVVSVAPALGFIYASNIASAGSVSSSSSTTLFHAQFPVLIGFEVPGGHELVLGPRLVEAVEVNSPSNGSSRTTSATLLGGSFGFALRARPNLRVMPEVSFASKIAGDGSNGGVGVQFGVGFLFGQ